jgi:membrane protein YdbS with pleckstrin-like domain
VNKQQKKILIPMVILIASIIIGFTLLAMVYHGNSTVESAVIIAVIVIIFALVKMTKSLVKAFGNEENESIPDSKSEK